MAVGTGPMDCICKDEVVQAINEIKSVKKPLGIQMCHWS